MNKEIDKEKVEKWAPAWQELLLEVNPAGGEVEEPVTAVFLPPTLNLWVRTSGQAASW